MIDQAVERFERQLTHQIDGFRDDLRVGEAALQTELRVLDVAVRGAIADCRQEMREGQAALRVEIHELQRAIARESAALGATLRSEMAEQRMALCRWAIVFWLGQWVGLGTLLAVMLRS